MGYWSDSPTPDDSDAFWIKFDLLLEPSILQDGDIVFAWLELADPYNDGYFETVGCYNRISNLSLAQMNDFGVQNFYGANSFALETGEFEPDEISFFE